MPKRKKGNRVSGAQLDILLSFLERNPFLCKSRGSDDMPKRNRKRTTQLWEEVAECLNAEMTGTCKTAKEWAIYTRNYKYKLKKMLADFKSNDKKAKDGFSIKNILSEKDQKFAAIMGPEFWQKVLKGNADSNESIEDLEEKPSISPIPRTLYYEEDGIVDNTVQSTTEDWSLSSIPTPSTSTPPTIASLTTTTAPISSNVAKTNENCFQTIPNTTTPASTIYVPPRATLPPDPRANLEPAQTEEQTLPRSTSRIRCRHLSTLEEARRALNEVEMQVEADDVLIEHVSLIEHHLERIANAVEKALQLFADRMTKEIK